jgi:DNA polymerase-3 subunit delta'
MYFKSVLGNTQIKNSLLEEFYSDRIPHAQLFYGGDSSQQIPMALAFVTYLFCEQKSKKDSCGACVNCVQMFKLTHPDLHFFYPTIKLQKNKEKTSESKAYFPHFQKTMLENPNLTIAQWTKNLKSSKSPTIRSADLNTLCKISNLRSYQGGYKVFIVWGAETIVTKSSSILLKTIEEPAPKTIFIFISNDRQKLLSTIKSRLQEKKFTPIPANVLAEKIKIMHPHIEDTVIEGLITSNKNNYVDIIESLEESSDQNLIINDFIEWVRLCFLSINKKSTYQNRSVIVKIVEWSNGISKLDKAYQMKFLKIAATIFRSAFLLNYNGYTVDNIQIENPDFSIKKFAKHIKRSNIGEIFSLLSTTHYYLSQYGNSKIIFLDLSFTLGKLLHKTENA